MPTPHLEPSISKNRQLLFIGVETNKQPNIQTDLSKLHFETLFFATTSQAVEHLNTLELTNIAACIIDDSALNDKHYQTIFGNPSHAYFHALPLILQINAPSIEVIQKALQKSIYFSINYPYDANAFSTVLQAAVHSYNQQSEAGDSQSLFEKTPQLLQKGVFRVKTVQDAQTLSSVLSFMTPNQKRVEIGLFELIVNGIEHGNLGIGYQEKTRLTAKGTLQAEIERRLDLPENQHKYVEVCVERFNDCLQFMIKDCGQGFDYKSYLDYVANRSLHHHGRGIMIANQLSFDALDYQESGSKVICKVNLN